MNNFQKFRKHWEEKGLLYAFWRGVKYLFFLLRKSISKKAKENFMPIVTIVKNKLKIEVHNFGIKLYWSNNEITQGIGFNSAINTLGLWTDSSKADWKIVEKSNDFFRLKLRFWELPLLEYWDIKIESSEKIYWQIEIEPEEDIYIDEFRNACLVSPCYKSWFSDCEYGDFPRITSWQNIPLNNFLSRNIGVRFYIGERFLPSLLLNFEDWNNGDTEPFIQNTSKEINAHLIGVKSKEVISQNYYFSGRRYKIFSGYFYLYENDEALDMKIEKRREVFLQNIAKECIKHRRKRVLLVNLPWQKDGKWGVRAGSRWPHIKDESEGNYLPFPFFLSYATSLLQRDGIEAFLIDAIAEEIPEDKFLERISKIDFDYLVAETSVPSFYEDLRILEKIHKRGIPIILCGPNALIYEPKFLGENPYIDYVLYGEYELSLLELIKSLQEKQALTKVRGLIYRQNDNVIKNPPRLPFDINILPWPYRDGLPMEKYWDLPGNIPSPSVQMVASRGCPFGCNFCLWPQVLYQGNHYRIRDIKDVVDEMEYLVREKGFKSVYWDDDTFNIGKERMLKFCQAIRERNLQKIPWAIMARPDLMDEEILKEMKSAGLWSVKYGIESSSQELVTNCCKNTSLEKTTRIINLTKELGIKVHLTFCFGLSGETKETVKRTVDYALDLDPESVQFSILTPFPGTSLFEELDSQGKILTYDWSLYDGHYNCVFKPDFLSPQDLEIAKRYAYLLWGEHLRRKRGLRGDMKRFKQYLIQYGLPFTLWKTFDYLKFIWIKKKRFLDGKN